MSLTKSSWAITDTINPKVLHDFQSIIGSKLSTSHIQSNNKFLMPGSHLLYFNSSYSKLDKDGYFNSQTPSMLLDKPDLTFRRRLWSKGDITFKQQLKFGSVYTCTEKVKHCKRIKDNYYVGIERLIRPYNCSANTESSDNSDYCIKETRWLTYTNLPPVIYKVNRGVDKNLLKRIGEFQFEDIDILRYGQLTLNPHRIHWDKNYSCSVEKYDNIIAQGPLIVQALIDIFNKHFTNLQFQIKSIKYKNVNNLYPDTRALVSLEKAEDDVFNLYLTDEKWLPYMQQ
ncbi:hypothetical protein TPHA_0E01160 [Tetrapisispora phaffii CBS 4417]|uniref:Uncharacterized protein n=1 Tax=Tetrapisispora phaffii (strain ATCC 24235 / CBS 4417 / NBRC 1672 / NRRL Y-8282 / UCD 70-5) TaxID=1071381 RepID=G8BTI2_TETPH|nr:hypothetical protein TPHA_0E01160 [Tetrapisispora phaffii CBS 4417]CCE63210.1 hypothetical protein TPHA_0E01160 [Tetrapisispora phaffii CBS 4417]